MKRANHPIQAFLFLPSNGGVKVADSALFLYKPLPIHRRRLWRCFLLVLLLFAHTLFAQHTHYNITDYGAVGDGITLCTAAINRAVEAASEAGGGTVVIPAGTYMSGTIVLKSNVELHLSTGATLMASIDAKDFEKSPQSGSSDANRAGSWNSFIYAENVHHIAITGKGTIDGNGTLQRKLMDAAGRKVDDYMRPYNVLMLSCRQVRVEGIRMVNACSWNQHYHNCEDVIIDRIEVFSHATNNNDALDFNGCRRVMVTNSIFDTDDDAITLKSRGTGPLEDVMISNCIVSSKSNAIKAGTESSGGFRNICISNCIIRPSRHREQPPWNTVWQGFTGISLEVVDGGVMDGVAINNIVMEEVLCPLYIRLGNRARRYSDTACILPVGKLRNVVISNITARNTGNFSSSITGIPGHCIENVSISNIQFFNRGGLVAGNAVKKRPAFDDYTHGYPVVKDYIGLHEDVPEDETAYPDAREWGNLPSYVFFIRHVRGLSIDNLTFGSNLPDPRIPIIAIDTERFSVCRSTYTGTVPATCFVLTDKREECTVEHPMGWGNVQVVQTVQQASKQK